MKRFVRVDDEGNSLGPIDYGWINGYPVGERALEGVTFKITIDAQGEFHAEVNPRDADYFATLNQSMWLKEVADFAKEYDVFSSLPDCSVDDVALEDSSSQKKIG